MLRTSNNNNHHIKGRTRDSGERKRIAGFSCRARAGRSEGAAAARFNRSVDKRGSQSASQRVHRRGKAWSWAQLDSWFEVGKAPSGLTHIRRSQKDGVPGSRASPSPARPDHRHEGPPRATPPRTSRSPRRSPASTSRPTWSSPRPCPWRRATRPASSSPTRAAVRRRPICSRWRGRRCWTCRAAARSTAGWSRPTTTTRKCRSPASGSPRAAR